MSYKLTFTKTAQKHFEYWTKFGSDKDKKKLLELLAEIQEHPRTGTGKIEQLSGDKAGHYSRRLNHKDRIVYRIHDDVIEVLILSMKGHYDDK